jgi:hypothetical protein
MVVAGEQTGKKIGAPGMAAKTGGVIGWAVDFAVSPGGDVSLPHLVYQASVVVHGIPVPCADASLFPGGFAEWHRKRENAEQDEKSTQGGLTKPQL